MRAVVLASFYLAAFVGCSASDNKLFQTTGFGAGNTGASGSGGGANGANGTGATGNSGTGNSGTGGDQGLGGNFNVGDAGPTSDCSAASQLAYVFSLSNEIYSFDPPTKVFTKVATPDCQASGTPNSMAIDRNLVAWLNYIGGIYKFDLNTKTGCTPSGITLPAGFAQIGMGFSSYTAAGTTETLYIDGIGGGGLAKIVNNTVVPIGKFSNDSALTGQSCELTGTGDAKLYGYFTTFPEVRVAQIDKTSANILSDFALPGISPPSDWAFTFWGGDFYLYAAPGTNNTGNSSVIHYTPSTKAVDPTYVADVGFQIIGAGVSTCAPLTPPQ